MRNASTGRHRHELCFITRPLTILLRECDSAFVCCTSIDVTKTAKNLFFPQMFYLCNIQLCASCVRIVLELN